MEKKTRVRGIFAPIIFTIISLGPIGWFVVDFLSMQYERLLFLFCISILLVILTTVFWFLHFFYKG